MELYLLGTGTCAPNPRRTPACYFLSAGPRSFIIDPGPGAVNRIIAAGLDPFGAEAVFISHHHLDHCADLPYYLFCKAVCPTGRDPRGLTIVAPPGFNKVYQGMLAIWGKWLVSDRYRVVIEEVGDAAWESGAMRFTAKSMLHGANGVGFRFERKGGPSLAYSGDTAYCEELVELAGGADTFLCECAWPNEHEVDGHMRPADVAQAALRAGVPRVILTHFYPLVNTSTVAADVRAAGYKGEIIVGEDGMKVSLGRI
ncbi:MAG: MBL fold metallo-hydrolase [Nitrospinae bacterium]|nr:MBL fold metallo-hydrolase [Nitrospinota bacterium]